MGIWRWGVILDAGSSGTRVHVYRWLNTARARQNAKLDDLFSLPKLQTKPEYMKKIHPGVSTFGDKPQDVGWDHLKGLLDHALNIIPRDQVKDTPIFLMATAGVRLLKPLKQRALLGEICAYTQQHTGFLLPDCDLHIQVIPGETEGLYGWIAVNYLLKGFDLLGERLHGNSHHTYGFLDMGGASAQIAFAPNVTETVKHANDLKLVRMRTLNGDTSEYRVFTTTWLGFGVNLARERYVASLMDASYTREARELLDPCLPSGLKTTVDGKPVQDPHLSTMLLGTGLFDECLRKTFPLLDKDAPCENQPCLLHSQHVPAIDWDINHFVGVSEYWYTTHEVFESVHQNQKYDFTTYQTMVKDFCSEEWEDIRASVESKKWGKKFDIKVAQEICFKASWLISVLHNGIGVPRVGIKNSAQIQYGTKELSAYDINEGSLDSFQAVSKISNTQVSWTLGKMVLYAAGQVPPSALEALPVGFGPNLGGPADFQEAGSNTNPADYVSDDDKWTEAAEELVEHANSRSTPGFLILISFLFFIGYLFRKRDRRLRLYRYVRWNCRPGSPRKGGQSIFHGRGKFLPSSSGSSASYERVFEDEDTTAEFELGYTESDENENSDSSGGSKKGRTSGLAAPKMNAVNFDMHNSYFDASDEGPVESLGLGLKPASGPGNPFDRAGLFVRTESRDRLGVGTSSLGISQMLGPGRRSLVVSPTRKSSLMAPLEEV